LIQPGAGLSPLVKAIDSARKSVEIFIFRCDRSEIERALDNAVRRGVLVHALIAYTNRGGNKSLRKLELRLLAKGVTVGRTNDDHASDPAMIRLLEARAAKGLSVRMIGSLKRKSSRIAVRRSPIRLHARTIVRDGHSVFIGSQGLREVELDARREVGIIFKD